MATDTVKEHDGQSEGGAWDGGQAPMKASYGKLMMWYFLLSDAFTFTGFLIAYGTLRFSSPTWPVPDFVFKTFPFVDASKEMPLIFVTVMSFVLIISSGTMVRAVQEGHRENQKGVVFWMLMTILGGATFLGCQAWEWSNLIGTEHMTVTRNPFGTHTHNGAYLADDGTVNSDDTFEMGASYLIHTAEHAAHGHGGGHGDDHGAHGDSHDEHQDAGHDSHTDAHDDHHGDTHAVAVSSDAYAEGDHGGYVVKDGFVLRKYKIQEEDGSYSDDTYTEAFGPKAFGALFFAITGFHGFHVFSGVLFLFIIMINAASGQYAARKNGYEMVEKIGLYWHFVDLVWVFVFLAFYLL